ncbi:MAG TPA: NEAT domain-containing protein [Limosilactobacillus ingluviei]|nr:NEAT domain-containing protein [Limosilactobacillus ingluviei]
MTVGSKITYQVITSVSLMGLVGAPLAAASPVLPVLVHATTPAATTIPTTARFFKTGTTTASDASHFFSDQASLKTTNGQLQLVMTMPTGANYVQKLQIQGSNQAATIQKNGEQATVTFNLPNQSGKYVVEMDLQLAPGMTMHEAADLQVDLSQVKTASAEADSSQTTSSSQTTTSTTKSDHQQAQSTTQVSQSQTTPLTQSTVTKQDHDDVLQLPVSFLKYEDYPAPSESGQFFSKTVSVKPTADGYQLTFHLIGGAQFISGITFNGQKPVQTVTNGAKVDYSFKLSKQAYQQGGGVFNFDLSVLGNSQQAYAVWNTKAFNPTKSQAQKPQPPVPKSSGHVIDSTKEIQDIPYAVYNEQRTKLSDANSFYTHVAHVIKTGTSGYDVTLTIKAAKGTATFAPISMKAGPITNQTHSQIGNQDIWTYTFHVNDDSALDQPFTGLIKVGVPLLGMPAQDYGVWFAFGQEKSSPGPSASSTTGYGTGNAAAALSASGPAGGDITSQPGAANAAAITPFDLKAAQKRLAHYRVPNGIKHRIQAALVDYPIVQALTAFLVTGFAIIGGTMLWYTHATRKLKGSNHEED